MQVNVSKNYRDLIHPLFNSVKLLKVIAKNRLLERFFAAFAGISLSRIRRAIKSSCDRHRYRRVNLGQKFGEGVPP